MYLTIGITNALAAAALFSAGSGMAGAQTQAQDPKAIGMAAASADKAAIAALVASYEDALNASDTNKVMALYADDGVFMPPYRQSAVGAAAVREAYAAVFKAITLSVKFHVVEVVPMSPEWAFARTNSGGTVTDHATGAKSAEGNQELFIFNKGADGAWKIARYSFSSTNPPTKL